MTTFFLTIAAILFIATYGIHSIIIIGNPGNRPNIYLNPILSVIPYLSGFILPIIPIKMLIDYNLILIFIINLIVVFFLSPIFAKILLVNYSNRIRMDGSSDGEIMAFSFLGGIIFMILGFLFK